MTFEINRGTQELVICILLFQGVFSGSMLVFGGVSPRLTPASAAPIGPNVFLSAASQATQRMRTAVCHSTAIGP